MIEDYILENRKAKELKELIRILGNETITKIMEGKNGILFTNATGKGRTAN